MKINVSLLRERYIIKEVQQAGSPENTDKNYLKVVAPSNRMPVTLQSGEDNAEELVVRANNLQNCIRFASQIVKEYEAHGPLYHRLKEKDWRVLWDKSLNPYERKYNPLRWVSVYHNGTPCFKNGEYHQFFDVIEKCDIVNKESYESSIELAQNSFAKAGREVHIEYDSNVGLISEMESQKGRCGMLIRGMKNSMTFNFYLTSEQAEINHAQVLSAAAAFLEGAQLAYVVGSSKAKLRLDLIKKYSDEYYQMNEAMQQIKRIQSEVDVLENRYNLRYRPEKPLFSKIIDLVEQSMFERLEKENQS